MSKYFGNSAKFWLGLLDDRINYKLLEDRKLNGLNYRVVAITFDPQTGEYQDKVVLYINPTTYLVDQFLFNVQAFNIQEPLLMRVKYQEIKGVKIMNYRELTESNWKGEILKDEWTKEVSTNIKFNNGFTKKQLKSV